MLKSFAKTTFFAVALSGLFIQTASADFMKKLSVSPASNGIGGPEIEVESDGQSWTRIKPVSRGIEMRVDIEAGSGWRVTNAYIGVPNADFGGTSNQSAGTLRLGGGKDVKSLKFVQPFNFHTDNLAVDAQAIVNACNSGDHPATQEHTVFSDVGVGIKAYFRTRRDAKWDLEQAGENDSGRSQTAYARAQVTIRCLAGPSHAELPPKPVSVDIRVTQKGDSCPKDADVTAFIDYEKQMTGRFQVVHNGKPGETIEIKARKVSFAGKTWYRIERLERYKLDPGKHDFQIKVVGGGESKKESIDVNCPPFKVTSAWLNYEVENKDVCKKQVIETASFFGNGPGDAAYRVTIQGGLVATQGTAQIKREGDKYVARRTRTLTMGEFDKLMKLEIVDNPSVGDQKPLKVECLEPLSGKLTLKSFKANACKGEALVAIHTNGAGTLPYELECGPGKSWQRNVSSMGNKIGVDKVQFDVTNNEQVTCVLRTRIDGKLKPLDGASMTYQCHKTTGLDGSKDLAPETKPDGQKPDKPGKPDKVVIDPPRKPDAPTPDKVIVDEPEIRCANGTVKNGDCACARTDKKVKAGKNAWRCVKVVVDPKPVKPTVSEPKISCANGTVKNGACACNRTDKKVKAGKNAWRCVKVVTDPPKNKTVAKRPAVTTSARPTRSSRRRPSPSQRP